MVKKQLLVYYVSYLLLFALTALLRAMYLNLPALLLFFVGGAIGAILPDVDHLIYVYFLRPHEVTSQRATSLMGSRKVGATFDLLYRTKNERTKLIFHTVTFQILFFVLALLVVSSSASHLGKGMVLAFLLHLSVDQYFDLKQGRLSEWFKDTSVRLKPKEEPVFWLIAFSSILFLAFVF